MSEIVDLSRLAPPKVIEELNFEDLLTARKQAFIDLWPETERDLWRSRLELESNPITKLLEENCYLQLLERSRINAAAQATMLAYATGSDLDVIAANFNVQRKTITPATDEAEAIMEDDAALRARAQLAFEGLSVAGPRNAYIYHALSAHDSVIDVSVSSPQPAHVTVTVLSASERGEASDDVLTAVRAALNDESVRPIGDRVTVQSARVQDYQITAKLYIYRGPEQEPIKAAALSNIKKYNEEKHRLGRDISLSGIYAALHVEGVQKIELTQPAADIILSADKVAYCTAVNIELVTSDDY